MSEMPPSDIDVFLETPRHAILGTNSPDGPPQLTPVWYLYEDDQVYMSVGTGTTKLRNLRRDPRVTLCVDGCHPDARAVMLHGTVEIIEEDGLWKNEMRWRIIRRYYETDAEARRYYTEVKEAPFVILVVTPDRVISQDFN
jgi:PPOX class probable F420-dependent enzyme